ncbi:MAG: alpha/beta hydrolase [Candidatus Competibacteraceae bacterium]|nr:alpha/beta hydrolase [Candidatus Competibacteraceae bacterium]
MNERSVSLAHDSIELEALYFEAESESGAVITHPHPLYGGDMSNPVVAAIAQAYQQAGYSTLRFNFRGVGNSTGRHGGGRDEQEDVRTALDYLHENGKRNVELAGYSFGAWVNAMAVAEDVSAPPLIMVAPPVALLDFEPVTTLPTLRLVITGEFDHYAPVGALGELLQRWNPQARLEVIPEADHFYFGYGDVLRGKLKDHFLDS